MSNTEDALGQILKILETKKSGFSVRQVIATVVSTLIVAFILGIFAWSTNVGKTNSALSKQIAKLDSKIVALINDQASKHNKLNEDINYDFKIIGEKLNITLKELK